MSNRLKLNVIPKSGNSNFEELIDSKIASALENITDIESKITYGTTDLTAGTSDLPSGVVYFVYE
jgi:hypothetical protein